MFHRPFERYFILMLYSLFIYLFGVLRRFQHCTGHITMGSWKGRGKQYIQFVRVLYCKLLTNGKQLPAFPLEAMPGIESRPQRWKARVLPHCHRGPFNALFSILSSLIHLYQLSPLFQYAFIQNLVYIVFALTDT